MISSARPSLKYSFSLSPLMFANGSTAIDGPRSAVAASALERCPAARRPSGSAAPDPSARHRRTMRSSAERVERPRLVPQQRVRSLRVGVARRTRVAPRSARRGRAPKLKMSRPRIERLFLGPARATCMRRCRSRRRRSFARRARHARRASRGRSRAASPGRRGVTMTFDGLRSRCRMPRACAASQGVRDLQRQTHDVATKEQGPRASRPRRTRARGSSARRRRSGRCADDSAPRSRAPPVRSGGGDPRPRRAPAAGP